MPVTLSFSLRKLKGEWEHLCQLNCHI